MTEALQRVDHTALKVNQLTIIVSIVLAFIFDLPWLVALVGVVMLAGTIMGIPGFLPLYRYVLKPLGLARPNILADNPEPHRFAQGLGAGFLLLGAAALYLSLPVLGWGLAWVVVALAALNVFAGFCLGCFFYYWLARLRLPGFDRQPPEGSFPGFRPKGEAK